MAKSSSSLQKPSSFFWIIVFFLGNKYTENTKQKTINITSQILSISKPTMGIYNGLLTFCHVSWYFWHFSGICLGFCLFHPFYQLYLCPVPDLFDFYLFLLGYSMNPSNSWTRTYFLNLLKNCCHCCNHTSRIELVSY